MDSEKLLFVGYVETSGKSYGFYAFYNCDGTIKAEQISREHKDAWFWDYSWQVMERVMTECGYDYVTKNDELFAFWLYKFNGKKLKEFYEFLKERGDQLRERRRKRDDFNRRFKNNIVVGIDKHIDIFETGFSVRVLFKSETTQKERKKFGTENKKDFVLWAMEEIQETKSITNKIGDICFYEPKEIVFLRIPEAEIKFEVKDIDRRIKDQWQQQTNTGKNMTFLIT